MRNYLLLIYIFLSLGIIGMARNASAQTVIHLSGSLLERGSKQPVIANFFVGLLEAKTTANGKFQLEYPLTKSQSSKPVMLDFAVPGYEHVYITVAPPFKPVELAISLTPFNQTLNQVVVTSGRYEQNNKRSTVSMEVVKPYLIQNKVTTKMENLLDQIPGVNVVDGQINIRSGSGWTYGAGSRVLVMVDDMPFLTGDAAQVKWNFLPIENVKQVEVLKGASSVLYGSSALNGIIHFRTEMAEAKPITRINVFGGVYDQPKRESLRWSSAPLKQGGFNAFHSFRFKQNQAAFSLNYFKDEGYRYGENDNRLRFNLNLKFKPSATFQYGLNVGALVSEGASFLLWKSYEKAYTILDSQVTTTRSSNINIDPSLQLVRNGFKHQLRGRFLHINNENSTTNASSDQSNRSNLFYGEYQVQKGFGEINLMLTGGAVASKTVSHAPLYGGDNQSENEALFLQADHSTTRKLVFNAGVRLERFVLNQSAPIIKPVLRAGMNAELAKATFLRASYGQGYRFPSIAERYISTKVGALNVFPNPDLKPESGWNAELGLRQGFKLKQIMGFFDAAYFYTYYNNMVEFNFAPWKQASFTDPFGHIGFKSVNIGPTKVTGIDCSINAQGKIGNVQVQSLIGYTYTKPIVLNPDLVFATDSIGRPQSFRSTRSDSTNILKYRYEHLAKADVQFTYKRLQFGVSERYNSFMKNVDAAFVSLPLSLFIPGMAQARQTLSKGSFVTDLRLSYQTTKTMKIAFVVNNLFNAEIMTRPGDLRPPRLFITQVGFSF